MHRIFVGGKGRKHMVADCALEPVQVHAWALWLDADEHHRRLAPWTSGALKYDRWNGGRRALSLGHDASLRTGGSATLSVTDRCHGQRGDGWKRTPNQRLRIPESAHRSSEMPPTQASPSERLRSSLLRSADGDSLAGARETEPLRTSSVLKT